MTFSPLELTLVLLGSAVLGVVAFRMMHLPPMLGYLAVGILIGPHALGWAMESEATHGLAEFGVVFLMFSIGLEFSLGQLRCCGSKPVDLTGVKLHRTPVRMEATRRTSQTGATCELGLPLWPVNRPPRPSPPRRRP